MYRGCLSLGPSQLEMEKWSSQGTCLAHGACPMAPALPHFFMLLRGQPSPGPAFPPPPLFTASTAQVDKPPSTTPVGPPSAAVPCPTRHSVPCTCTGRAASPRTVPYSLRLCLLSVEEEPSSTGSQKRWRTDPRGAPCFPARSSVHNSLPLVVGRTWDLVLVHRL